MNVYDRAVATAIKVNSIFIDGFKENVTNEDVQRLTSMAFSHSERPAYAREILHNVLETLDFFIALTPKKRDLFEESMHTIFEAFWDTL